MRRIQRVSKVVKLVAHALSVVCLLFALTMVFQAFNVMFEYESLRMYVLHGSVLMAVLMAMFHKLARLAENYERGELFGVANVRHLRALGWLILLTAVTVDIVPSHSVDDLSTTFEFNPGSVIASFLFIFMSWVMDEARKLDEEHGLTI